MDKIKLSKTISYILRHHPEDFDLQINPDGSLEVNKLIKALQKERFSDLTFHHLKQVVNEDKKGRFSFLDNEKLIRANYGHSIDGVHPDYECIKPPEVLYHGTARQFKDSILQEGLKPMNRNFVHLSGTQKEAMKVGNRRDSQPIILIIKASKADQDGQNFYLTGKGIYLTDYIAPDYIETG